jgi:hypothetical protein
MQQDPKYSWREGQHMLLVSIFVLSDWVGGSSCVSVMHCEVGRCPSLATE